MAWGKVDDKLHSSPKWRTASKGGRALWVTGLSWCMDQETDGFVPKAIVSALDGSTADVKSLVAAGLWVAVDGGYEFHNWAKYQPSKASLDEKRSDARDRMQRARESKRSQRVRANEEGTGDGVSEKFAQPPSPSPSQLSEPDGSDDVRSDPGQCREDVEQVCKHLADAVEANGSKRPHVSDRWRTEARRLIDLDGRTPDQILRAIDWCQSDAFWRANVLSMPKLREKYDQLRLAAEREQAQSRSADPRGDALRAAMERARALDEAEAAQRLEISA